MLTGCSARILPASPMSKQRRPAITLPILAGSLSNTSSTEKPRSMKPR